MARRSAWSCPGSTASRARSRSCGSGSRAPSRRPRGTRPPPRSTASTRTSTPPSTTRAGARRPSGGSASSDAAPRFRSTDTPIRWRISTPAWTSGRTTKASRVAPRPHRAQGGDLGGVSGTSGDARVLVRARRPHGEPHQLRHDHARRLDAPDPPGLTRDDADPARPPRLVADHAAAAPGALRVLLRVPPFQRVDRARLLLRLAPDVGGHREAALHHDGHARASLAAPARCHVDGRDDQAAGRAAVAAPPPARVRRPGGGLPALPVAGEGRAHGSVLVRGAARPHARDPPRSRPPPRRAPSARAAGDGGRDGGDPGALTGPCEPERLGRMVTV